MACIPRHIVERFKEKLRTREITFDLLSDPKLSSEARRKIFARELGEAHAKRVNASFERKLLLVDQRKGMIDFIKTIAGMKKETKRDIISRVERMEKVLQPDGVFLDDLAAQMLGFSVTSAEATAISQLANDAKAKEKLKKEAADRGEGRTKYGRPPQIEMDYGNSVVAFENLLRDLKADTRSAKERAAATAKDPIAVVKLIGDSSKALKASFDLSFIGRQGIRIFYLGLAGDTRALRNYTAAFFKNMELFFKTFKDENVLDTLRAEEVSSPQHDLMRIGGVATSMIEEDFPVSWPTRIPGILGKIFKASENAFIGTAYYLRARTAEQMFDIAESSGIDLTDKNELQNIGKLVNSLTARGDTGAKSQKPGLVNAVLWSPKMIKGNIDVMLLQPLGGGGFSKDVSTKRIGGEKFGIDATFAQRRAAINLLRIIVGQAAGVAGFLDLKYIS